MSRRLRFSSALTFLTEHQITAATFDDVESARRALSDDKVQAVVYDGPILRYVATKSDDSSLKLGAQIFKKEKYAFALPERSVMRKELNEILLGLAEKGFLDELEKKWFPRATEDD